MESESGCRFSYFFFFSKQGSFFKSASPSQAPEKRLQRKAGQVGHHNDIQKINDENPASSVCVYSFHRITESKSQ